MTQNSFITQAKSIKFFIIVGMIILLTCEILRAENNYIQNGDFEKVTGNQLVNWEHVGEVTPKAVGGIWRKYTVEFNSRKYRKVNFYFCVSRGTIGSIWIDNVACAKAQIKNGSFENQEPNGRFTSWSADNFKTALFPDSSRSSDGKKSVRITFKNEVVPDTRAWQTFKVKPNQKYAVTYDVFVGDDFQGTARGLVYDSGGTAHLTSNYSEISVVKQLENRDRCEKYVAVLTGSPSKPAEMFQDVVLKPEMNLQISADINMKKFKGKVSLIAEDAVSGKLLRKVDAKDAKDKWQNLYALLQTKSSKIRLRVVAQGEGFVQIDNVAITPPKITPPVQNAKWLPSSENFIIPSTLNVFVFGKPGKSADGGLELLSKDLKKYDVSLVKASVATASLQILVGEQYAVRGKGAEAYNLKIAKTGITIKAVQ